MWPLAESVPEDSLPPGLRDLFRSTKPLSATSYRDADGPNELDHLPAASARLGCASFMIGVGALFTALFALQQTGRIPEEWAGVGEVPPTWRTTALLVLAATLTILCMGLVVHDLWARWRLPPGRYGVFLLRDTLVVRAALRPIRCTVIPREEVVHIGQVTKGAAGSRRRGNQLQYRREDGSTGAISLDGLTNAPGLVLAARLLEWRQ